MSERERGRGCEGGGMEQEGSDSELIEGGKEDIVTVEYQPVPDCYKQLLKIQCTFC